MYRLRSLAGLAAAVIPFAILVHLAAEAAAIGREGMGAGFVVRHGYFGALFLAAVVWFGSTVGLGRSARERRRRCALLLSQVDVKRGSRNIWLLIGANVAFFALTQVVEGIPIASGAIAVGLIAALAGSLLSAVTVFVFGRTVIVAALESVLATAPLRIARPAFTPRDRTVVISRCATSAFSLFVPNRPPPAASRF